MMPTCQSKSCGYVLWQNSKPCVSIIITNEDGQVLMTVRGTEPDKGKLDLPGGFLEYGEMPEDGAIREVKEEIGVEIKIGEYLGCAIDHYYYQDIDNYTLVIGLSAQIENGKPYAADSKEIAAIEWVNPVSIDKSRLAFTCNEKFLRRAKHKE